jgi:small-conductance mechanosensitive channel
MGNGTPMRGRGARAPRAPRRAPETPSAPELIVASTPSPVARRTVTGLLLRFISCGLLALGFGIAWRFTLAPPIVGPGTAFAGIFALLLGFILGGILWYLHDARRRRRDPESVSDERLVFSFIVFAVMPFAVLVLVGAVWMLAFLIRGA